MPTGRVVGIVQRRWRDYTATFEVSQVSLLMCAVCIANLWCPLCSYSDFVILRGKRPHRRQSQGECWSSQWTGGSPRYALLPRKLKHWKTTGNNTMGGAGAQFLKGANSFSGLWPFSLCVIFICSMRGWWQRHCISVLLWKLHCCFEWRNENNLMQLLVPFSSSLFCRIVVRVDSWEIGSQYPNGHFVRDLGCIGNLETEVAAILTEHNISVPPFSDALVSAERDWPCCGYYHCIDISFHCVPWLNSNLGCGWFHT